MTTLIDTPAQVTTRDLARPVSRATFAIGAAVLAGLLVVATHLARPELDPSWVPISDHALGARGWIMTAAFLVWGSASLAAALVVRSRLRGKLATAAAVFIAIGGVGPIVAGLFPADPAGTPMDQATWHGAVHAVGPMLADGTAIGAALLLAAVLRAGHRSRVAPLVIATVAAWIAVIWVIVSLAAYVPATGVISPDTPVGWANRAMVAAFIAYPAVAAWWLRRLPVAEEK